MFISLRLDGGHLILGGGGGGGDFSKKKKIQSDNLTEKN